MTDDDSDQREDGVDRRQVLRTLGAAGATSVFGAESAAARGGSSKWWLIRLLRRLFGKHKDDKGGGPPEKCECPEGTFIAKYEVVKKWHGWHKSYEFELVEGEDVVEITDVESKHWGHEPVAFTYTAEGYTISQICSFGGRDTHTVENPDGSYASDLTNPGGKRAAISNVTFCGEPSEPEECADLDVEYECTTYDFEEPANWRRTGTRFRVTNNGDAATDFGLAVTNDVNTFRPVDSRTVGAGGSRAAISDSSIPIRALAFWESPCDLEGAETWAEFKARRGFDSLSDFYDGAPPATAPADLPNDYYVVEAENIPGSEEPDEDIPDAQYPDMSSAAEAAGWITCDKHDNQ